MIAWFWWWLLFVVLLFALPLGYGWGYRRWGPPYPSWSGRARVARANEAAATWGFIADVVWIVLVIALVWLIIALLV